MAGISPIPTGNGHECKLAELSQVAASNKLQPLLAQILGKRQDWEHRYQQFLNTVARIGELLSELDYSIIKTLRPIPHTPSDIDILIKPSEFNETYRRLSAQKFSPLDKSPFGVTLHDPKTRFNVDLSWELTVVGLKYLDRDLILDNTIEYELSGSKIKVPHQSVDLLIVVDHSVFKEGMYTLRDFYTIMPWFQYLRNTIGLAYQESDALAMQAFLVTTYLILKESFGTKYGATEQFAQILVKTPNGNVPTLPYKYPLIDVARAFLSKTSYFMKNGCLNGFAANSGSTKTVRLFVNYFLRRAY